MNAKIIIATLAITVAFSAPCLNRADAADPQTPQAKLQAQAKISESKAREIALANAPGGAVQASELEEENGHLVWSFDISLPSTKNILEVQVDAKDGTIVSSTIETPLDQAKEAVEDKSAAMKSEKEKADVENDEKKCN